MLGEIPDLAPEGQNHLLSTTGGVRTIQYNDDIVAYEIHGPSTDVLKLAFVPREVSINGKTIPPNTPTWTYHPKTHLCVIHQAQGKVRISRGERTP